MLCLEAVDFRALPVLYMRRAGLRTGTGWGTGGECVWEGGGLHSAVSLSTAKKSLVDDKLAENETPDDSSIGHLECAGVEN